MKIGGMGASSSRRLAGRTTDASLVAERGRLATNRTLDLSTRELFPLTVLLFPILIAVVIIRSTLQETNPP